MRFTEGTMWNKLSSVVKLPDLVTRIESMTGLGISDVEYVVGDYHGWVEFKVAQGKRETSLARLNTDFTIHQFSWLNLHHKPERYLRSWLVIARQLSARKEEWFMIVPAMSIRLVKGDEVTIAELRTLADSRVYNSAQDVYAAMRYWSREIRP